MKRTNIFPNKFKVINGKIPKYYQYQSIWFFFFFLEREKQHNIIVNSYLCVSGQ
jgi:hypothetical protein